MSNKTIKAKNIYYFNKLNAIGGTESFLYYLAKKYKDKDLVIVYSIGDEKQIKRLKKYVNVIKFTGQKIECEKAFFNYSINIIDNVYANEYYVILHGDYKTRVEQGQLNKNRMPIHPKITKYIGVSQLACDSFYELTGKECEVCYNPISLEGSHKKLHLISATRLTAEKGKDRIIKLINILDNNNIDFEWIIYTDDTNKIKHPKVIYKKPTLDIVNEFKYADYLVQLSDSEGYCYSIVESLAVGTPVICTPCPVFDEIGLKNGENCYYVDFDMKDIPLDDIVNNIPSFTYTPKEDNWGNLLASGESQYQKDLHTLYEVQATSLYRENDIMDAELKRIPKRNEKWYTNKLRAEMLLTKGYVKFTGKDKFDKDKKI